MRSLVILRGSPASGKSTWIKEMNLENYTLCADTIRLLVESPIIVPEKKHRVISQKNDNYVWQLLFELLEKRMARGEFVIIDATHSRSSDFSRYNKLCERYRYRKYYVDFSDVPLEECKRRNSLREDYKRVPEKVIDKMYSRLRTQGKTSGWVKVDRNNFWNEVGMKLFDLNKYEKIHIWGDLHGNYQPIAQYVRQEYFGFNYDIEEYWKKDIWLNLQNLKNEEWKDIKDYEGLYQISNYGRIKSLGNKKQGSKSDTDNICIQRLSYNGYLYINLCKDSTKKTFKIHRLVAEHFGLDISNEINHIDGLKVNNNIKNLEPAARKSNEEHCWNNKLKVGRGVNMLSKDNKILKTFNSIKDAATDTKINESSIIHCCSGVYKTAGGYKWAYNDDKKNNRSGKAIKVRQYSLEGDLITEYSSITEAEKVIGTKGIRACISGKTKSSGGFLWECVDIEYKNDKKTIVYPTEYLKNLINENEFYIFTGDYIDRGLQNKETLEFLMELSKCNNVLLLEGNHERWINYYSLDEIENIKSHTFLKKTMLEILDIDKKELRAFYRKIGQIAYFTYDNQKYIVSHGGISYTPEELQLIATDQFINGVGDYNTNIDEIYTNNYKDSLVIQVHSHRNVFEIDDVAMCSFNLEGKVEFGGHLRILQLKKGNYPNMIKIKNNYFGKVEEVNEFKECKANIEISMIEQLRSSNDIKETVLDNNISSFNFTHRAFYNKNWNNLTCKARGLFVDTTNNKVVARGYEKFFNVNERIETELEHLLVKFKNEKITCYKKENGYLGIMSMVNGELFIASKSTNKGEFAEWFRKIYENSDINKQQLEYFLEKNNVSLTFEVIDVENDPHIIEYDKSKIVLLDIIHNDYEFKKEPYERVQELSKLINCECKSIYKEFDNVREFHKWYLETTDEDDLSKEDIEGVVIECNGIMTKLKFPYYNFWKFMRRIKEQVLHKSTIKLASLFNATSNYFYAWLKEQDEETLKQDIITLRKKFYNSDYSNSINN